MGAKVYGFSLPPLTAPNLFSILKIESPVETSVMGDITDFQVLRGAVGSSNPDIVIHMAAQALVRRSYDKPIETYSTNVMGTVHLLEAVKVVGSAKAVEMGRLKRSGDDWTFEATGKTLPEADGKKSEELLRAVLTTYGVHGV